MDFHLLHFYPDLMNLYGSYANVRVLGRLLERLGHTVTVEAVTPGQETDLSQLSGADFLYMGAGTERRARFAMEDWGRYGEGIRSLAEDGVPMLYAGTAMELLGESVTTAEGGRYEGIALASFATVQERGRRVGDVLGHTDLFPEPLVGFLNKSGVIRGIDTPLLTSLDRGYGNESDRGPEGFHRWNVFASELTGPILVKNPRLLEVIAGEMLKRRGISLPEAWPVDTWAQKGYAVTVRELGGV